MSTKKPRSPEPSETRKVIGKCPACHFPLVELKGETGHYTGDTTEAQRFYGAMVLAFHMYWNRWSVERAARRA